MHYVGKCLIDDPGADLVNKTCPDSGETIDQSHIQSALTYVDECLSYKKAAVWSAAELTLDGSWLHPDVGGTPDFGALMPSGELVVIDEKNGYETADADLQLLVYALLVIQYLSTAMPDQIVRSITLIVVQPNCEDPGARRIQKHYPDAAVFFKETRTQLESIIASTEDPSAPRVPGKQCKYCQAAALCPENRQRVNMLAAQYFKVAEREVKQLTAEELGEEMQFIEELQKLVKERGKALTQHGFHMADKLGLEIPGKKLVDDLANRQFINKPAVVDTLRLFGVAQDAIYEVRSPAQLENLVPKGLLDSLTERRVKGKKLVSSTGRGAPTMASINQWFNR